MEEEPQDVDFGPDPMDFDVPESLSPRITLTPPKNPTRKRAFLPVPTDHRIELSDEMWKRQCTELAIQVATASASSGRQRAARSRSNALQSRAPELSRAVCGLRPRAASSSEHCLLAAISPL